MILHKCEILIFALRAPAWQTANHKLCLLSPKWLIVPELSYMLYDGRLPYLPIISFWAQFLVSSSCLANDADHHHFWTLANLWIEPPANFTFYFIRLSIFTMRRLDFEPWKCLTSSVVIKGEIQSLMVLIHFYAQITMISLCSAVKFQLIAFFREINKQRFLYLVY